MLWLVASRLCCFKSVNHLGVAGDVGVVAEPFDVDSCLFHLNGLVLALALVSFLEEIS